MEMDIKYDITLLNTGLKKDSIKKLMLDFISDKEKIIRYLNNTPCRIITNISEEEAKVLSKKFKRRGADVISMECDFLTLRNSKLEELLK